MMIIMKKKKKKMFLMILLWCNKVRGGGEPALHAVLVQLVRGRCVRPQVQAVRQAGLLQRRRR